MEILAQSGFQADLPGEGSLSSLLTSAFGESRGKCTVPYTIIAFLTGETGVCGVLWDSYSNKGRISGLCITSLLPPCELPEVQVAKSLSVPDPSFLIKLL